MPTFRTAAQSLLESKKKKHRAGGEVEHVDGAGGYKIAIPVAVLRGSRHARPYYPHDVGRQVQRDLDVILGQGHETHDHRINIDDICAVPEELTGQDYTKAEWLDGRQVSCRRGRGGRLVFDRLHHGTRSAMLELGSGAAWRTRFLARGLTAKDFSQLQTPVGNYNVHAVQTANQITRPMSFQAWLASTASIMQALNGSKPKSPKKKRPKGDGSDAHPTGESTVEIAKLGSPGATTASGQITVKVKSQPKETRKGTGARFTPHGLAPENEVAVDVK